MSVHQKSVTRDESLVLIAFGHHVGWCGGRMKSTMFGCDMLRACKAVGITFPFLSYIVTHNALNRFPLTL